MNWLILIISSNCFIINNIKCMQDFYGEDSHIETETGDLHNDQDFHDNQGTPDCDADKEMLNNAYDYGDTYYAAPHIGWENKNLQNQMDSDINLGFGQTGGTGFSTSAVNCKVGYIRDETGKCKPEFYQASVLFSRLFPL
ncbi:uncharacterized protein LOC142319173 [Lycorma delicatula]|uniref:uncharacterized protein LOC142319173 n=1 Tax=Lycorma delicatula TaxID=130591 RepID=UPI003F5163C8